MGNIMGIRQKPPGAWAVISASVAIALAGTLRADLAPASPFLPPNVAGAAGGAAGPAGPIELRGVMSTPDGYAFCIYDTAKKKDVWVGMNENGHDFVVRSSDPGSDSVKVDYQGRTLRLTLKAPKVASAGPAIAAPAVVQRDLAPGPPNQNPGDEQRRLDAVAQEVRRRRQEREKAAQDAQNGQVAPAPASVPAPPAR